MTVKERIEAFVVKAVPGSSEKRREVREELRSHLEECMEHAMREGKSEEEAYEEATRQIGRTYPLRRWLFWSSLRARLRDVSFLLCLGSLVAGILASLVPIAFIPIFVMKLVRIYIYVWMHPIMALVLYGLLGTAFLYQFRPRPFLRHASYGLGLMGIAGSVYLGSHPDGLIWPCYFVANIAVALSMVSVWAKARRIRRGGNSFLSATPAD